MIGLRPSGVGLPLVGVEGTVGAGDYAGELGAYHDSGEYAKDLAAVGNRARRYLVRRSRRIRRDAAAGCARAKRRGAPPKMLAAACRKPKLGIVFDIDETTLSNYSCLAPSNFEQAVVGLLTCAAQATSPAIRPTKRIYNYAVSHGIGVYFITGPARGHPRGAGADGGEPRRRGLHQARRADPRAGDRLQHRRVQVGRAGGDRTQGRAAHRQRRRPGVRPRRRARRPRLQVPEPVLLHRRVATPGGSPRLPRASRRRRPRGPAGPPPRPRHRRERLARAGRRARPRAPAARRLAAGAADAPRLARLPLVRGPAGRLPGPGDLPRQLPRPRGLPRRPLGADGARPRADGAGRLLDGVGDELLAGAVRRAAAARRRSSLSPASSPSSTAGSRTSPHARGCRS